MLKKIDGPKDYMYLFTKFGVVVLSGDFYKGTCKQEGWVGLKDFSTTFVKYMESHNQKDLFPIQLFGNDLIGQRKVNEEITTYIFEIPPSVREIQYDGRENLVFNVLMPYLYFVINVKAIDKIKGPFKILKGYLAYSDKKIQNLNDSVFAIPLNNIHYLQGELMSICWGDIGDYNIEKEPSKSDSDYARKVIDLFLRCPFNTELGKHHIPNEEKFSPDHEAKYKWQVNFYREWSKLKTVEEVTKYFRGIMSEYMILNDLIMRPYV